MSDRNVNQGVTNSTNAQTNGWHQNFSADGVLTDAELDRMKVKYGKLRTKYFARETTAPSTADTRELFELRPSLQQVRASALSRAKTPWGVLGGALSESIARIPACYSFLPEFSKRGSANAIIGLVGGSFSGKGTTTDIARGCFIWPSEFAPLLSLMPKSGEAFVKLYKQPPSPTTAQPGHTVANAASSEWIQVRLSSIVEIPEVRSIGSTTKYNGALVDTLLKTWSGEGIGGPAMGLMANVSVEACTYRIVIMIGIQQENIGILVEYASSGLPQRIIWMPTQSNEDAETRDEYLRWLNATIPPMMLTGIPELRLLSHDANAWAAEVERLSAMCRAGQLTAVGMPREIADYVKLEQVLLATERNDIDPLNGHSTMCRLSVALGLANLDNFGGRDTTSLSLEDWQIAGEVMRTSTVARDAALKQASGSMVTEHRRTGALIAHRKDAERIETARINDVNFQKAKDQILAKLREAGVTGCTVNELWPTRTVRSYRDRVIMAGITEKEIVLIEGTNPKTDPNKYVLSAFVDG